MHHLQPDYTLAREGNMQQLKGVGFQWPQYHDLDHQAVVTTIQAGKQGKRRLKAYRRKRQEFPLQLPPQELWDDLMTAFVALQATCNNPEAAKRHWHDWVSNKMWLLIKQCTSLCQAGRLCWCIGQRMQCTIYAALKVDHTARMVQVGESIVTNLAKGNVHEAFHHLKGWYRAAMETQARPCFQTMEKQTAEHVDLYPRRESPGPPVAVNIEPVDVLDDAPTNGEIQVAVSKLTNGCSAGASCMWVEHLKEWLRGMKSEEDLEMRPNNVGMGDRWRALAWLVQALWDEGRIPL
jgi:hypothetical protein